MRWRPRVVLAVLATSALTVHGEPTKPSPPPPGVADCPTGMVHVPAGTLAVAGHHDVALAGYCIDKIEVTVAGYAACAAARSCTAAPTAQQFDGADKYAQFDPLCNGTRDDRHDHPVNCIDWDQASAYCTWAGKRLPTEAEWEYAARGSDGRRYPWGNAAPTAKRLDACGKECVALGKRLGSAWQAMYDGDDGWPATAPVGSYPDGASPFGALDMAGNVAEWTADGYGRFVGEHDVTNPSAHFDKVFRGGSWEDDDPARVRADTRDGGAKALRYVVLGVRCARDEPARR